MKIDQTELKESSSEVPPACKAFTDELKTCSDEQLEELLKFKTWNFGKYDLYHWIDVLNEFDRILEASCKKGENQWRLLCDEPFWTKKRLLLNVLQFSALLIEHSPSCEIYSSMEHLITLLTSNDLNVVLAVLNVLYSCSKRSHLTSWLNTEKRQTLLLRLFCLAKSWGGKENGFGLAECCQDLPIKNYPFSTSTLCFEYYDEYVDDEGNKKISVVKLRVDDVDKIESLSEVMKELIEKYAIPEDRHVQLFTYLRFTHSFPDYPKRKLLVQARLLALSILVYSNAVRKNLNSILYNGLVEELVDVIKLPDPSQIEIKVTVLKVLTSIMYLDRKEKLRNVMDTSGTSPYQGFFPVLIGCCLKALGEPESQHFPLHFVPYLFAYLYHFASHKSAQLKRLQDFNRRYLDGKDEEKKSFMMTIQEITQQFEILLKYKQQHNVNIDILSAEDESLRARLVSAIDELFESHQKQQEELISAHQEEVTVCEKQTSSLEVECDEKYLLLKAEMKKVDSDYKEHISSQEDLIKKLMQKLSENDSTISAFESEKQKLIREHVQIQQKLNEEISSISIENYKNIKELRSQIVLKELAEENVNQLQSQIEETKEEMNRVMKELAVSNSYFKSEKNSKIQLEDQIALLQNQLGDEKIQNEVISKSLDDWKQQLKVTQAENVELKVKIDEANQQKNAIEDSSTKNLSQNIELRSTLGDLQRAHSDLKIEVPSLKKKLSVCESTLKVREEEITELIALRKKDEAKEDELEKEIVSLNQKLLESSASNEVLTKEIVNTKQKLSEIEHELKFQQEHHHSALQESFANEQTLSECRLNLKRSMADATEETQGLQPSLNFEKRRSVTSESVLTSDDSDSESEKKPDDKKIIKDVFGDTDDERDFPGFGYPDDDGTLKETVSVKKDTKKHAIISSFAPNTVNSCIGKQAALVYGFSFPLPEIKIALQRLPKHVINNYAYPAADVTVSGEKKLCSAKSCDVSAASRSSKKSSPVKDMGEESPIKRRKVDSVHYHS